MRTKITALTAKNHTKPVPIRFYSRGQLFSLLNDIKVEKFNTKPRFVIFWFNNLKEFYESVTVPIFYKDMITTAGDNTYIRESRLYFVSKERVTLINKAI